VILGGGRKTPETSLASLIPSVRREEWSQTLITRKTNILRAVKRELTSGEREKEIRPACRRVGPIKWQEESLGTKSRRLEQASSKKGTEHAITQAGRIGQKK